MTEAELLKRLDTIQQQQALILALLQRQNLAPGQILDTKVEAQRIMADYNRKHGGGK